MEIPVQGSSHTDPEKLRAQLHTIREKGFGIDNEESFDGVLCIAVPIFHSANELFGALSISGLASRRSQDIIPKMSKDIQITGYRISFDISSYYSGVSERMRGNHYEN
ncbi:MAG: hypothetical protein JSV89_01490 [Spirochaetaceae bacterium]|nr:MAG: hypothetical protein JSV89_01490 [Spirochaetaceae bacterium]